MGKPRVQLPFTPQERAVLRTLRTPEAIQDFLDGLAYNTEPQGDTCRSPRVVLRTRTAHCIEGAMLAALALRMHGHRPLILDFEAEKDLDHVICVFRRNGLWGAISMSKYVTLRYRDPVYRTLRELVLSYFPFYNNERGQLTLRRYSRPVNLARFDKRAWATSEQDVWFIPEYLLKIKHYALLPKHTRLRPLDKTFLRMDER